MGACRLIHAILPFSLPTLLVILAFAHLPSIARGATQTLETKGPVTITSSTLTVDNKAHTALFEGSVIAKTEEMTMYADRMTVSYTEGSAISRIDATGRVKVVKGERLITAAAATYFAAEEKVVFTGDPRAAEEGNVVSGSKITYLIKEDRSIVENSKVFIEKQKR